MHILQFEQDPAAWALLVSNHFLGPRFRREDLSFVPVAWITQRIE